MSDYRNLKVWQRTIEFVTTVYDLTKSFPAHELYGLTSQIRRAATSIALNITEGATSGYTGEFKRFLLFSIRSANEVATGFEIAKRLEYCSAEQANKQIREADEIAAMLQGLSKSLNKTSESPAVYSTDAPELTTRD